MMKLSLPFLLGSCLAWLVGSMAQFDGQAAHRASGHPARTLRS